MKHIESAAKHGADMIKIQTYEPEDITPKEKDFNHVIKSGIWKSRSLWSLFREACTPYDWHADAFALVDDLAETLNLTKADTLSYMVRDYTVMKNKERLREMQSLGLGH